MEIEGAGTYPPWSVPCSAAEQQVDCAANNLPEYVTRRFGVQLRGLMLDQQMVRVWMAVACNIDLRYISDVELGSRSLVLTQLNMVAEGLNLSLVELLQDL